MDFFKVWELFRKCVGNVFSFKRPTYSPLESSEALKNFDKVSPGLDILPSGVSWDVIWKYATIHIHLLLALDNRGIINRESILRYIYVVFFFCTIYPDIFDTLILLTLF